MKRAILITGIILVLISVLLTACGGSIAGEYEHVQGALTDTLDNARRLVLTDEGTFYFKTRTAVLEWGKLNYKWSITSSGEWDRQGDKLYLRNDSGSAVEATINGDNIFIGTSSVAWSNKWEKVN